MVPALAVHRQSGPFVLGTGESVRAGTYHFTGDFGHELSNAHRPLESATASFNSDRWMLGSESDHVTYRFGLPDQQFRAAAVRVNVNYHTRGGCRVEVSGDDGKTFVPLEEVIAANPKKDVHFNLFAEGWEKRETRAPGVG